MRLDLVAGHFDAGMHLGQFIEQDMIAVRVSADPGGANETYRWEFDKGKQSLTVAVEGPWCGRSRLVTWRLNGWTT
jgi:hypothetical protein